MFELTDNFFAHIINNNTSTTYEINAMNRNSKAYPGVPAELRRTLTAGDIESCGLVQRSRRRLEARLGAERWNLRPCWHLTVDSKSYIVTVNLRNQAHRSQHPELALCLSWAYLLVCERTGCQQGWYRAGHYSLSSLDMKR